MAFPSDPGSVSRHLITSVPLIPTAILLVLLVSASLGAAATLTFPCHAERIRRAIGGCWLTASLIWFLLQVVGGTADVCDWSLGTLVNVQDSAGIELAFRIDDLRAGLMLCAGLLLLCTVSSTLNGTAASMLPLASAVALMTTDFTVMLASWLWLESLLMSVLSGDGTYQQHTHRGLGRHIATLSDSSLFSLIRLSSGLLLLALLMIWSRFGVLSIDALLSGALADYRIDAESVVEGLTVVLAGAILVRLGLFPAMIWSRPAIDDGSDNLPLWIPLAAFLPAVALAGQTMPLSRISADGGLVLAGLGGLALVVGPALAVAQRTEQSIVSILQFGVAAQVAVVLGTGQPGSLSVALWLLLTQLPLLAITGSISSHSSSTDHQAADHIGKWQRVAIAALLLSGLCHQNATLQILRSEIANSTSVLTLGLPRDRVLTGVWWACVAGQCLTGFALSKCVCPNEPERTAGPSGISARLAVVMAASLVAPFLVSVPAAASVESLILFGAATPAGLLGGTIGWLLFRQTSTARPYVTTAFDSLIRLSRNWCYVDRVAGLTLKTPLVTVCVLCDLFDTVVLGRGDETVWHKSPAWLGRVVEHLRESDPMYLGVGAVLFVAGLLIALTQAGV